MREQQLGSFYRESTLFLCIESLSLSVSAFSFVPAELLVVFGVSEGQATPRKRNGREEKH